MAARTCAECGTADAWEQLDIGATICTHCGTLLNQIDVVLDSHVDVDPRPSNFHLRPAFAVSQPLRALRSGYTLPGASTKEAYHARNTSAVLDYITSLSSVLNVSAHASRAQFLFGQLVHADQHSFGRKSSRLAGACLALATREARRGDISWDLAAILQVSRKQVLRSMSFITHVLSLQIPVADASIHFPALRDHFSSFLSRRPTSFPSKLLNIISTLHPPNVMETAAAVYALFTRISSLEDSTDLHVTACAIFLLATEGEARTALPNQSIFVKELASRFGANIRTVMKRYHVLSQTLEDRMSGLPWLDTQPNGQESTLKKPKLGQRTVVARGLKDAIQFQEEIWRAKTKTFSGPILPAIDLASNEAADDVANLPESPQHRVRSSIGHPQKRARTSRNHFVADPHSATLHTSRLKSITKILSSGGERSDPSRLRDLLDKRNGQENIDDDELFADDELESFLRTEEEVSLLLSANVWPDVNSSSDPPRIPTKRKLQESQSRINMDAFNRIIDGLESLKDGDQSSEEDT